MQRMKLIIFNQFNFNIGNNFTSNKKDALSCKNLSILSKENIFSILIVFPIKIVNKLLQNNVYFLKTIFLQQFYNFQSNLMYTGFKPNTSVTKTVVSGLGQTQLETLQREVDNYTRKLEQEKKKYFSIQDTHRMVTQEYEKQKNRLNQLKKQSTKASNVIMQAKIKNLQASLEKAVSVYDETVSHNNKLKSEIDMLRREKKNFLQSQKNLQEQIKKYEADSQQKLNNIEQKKKKAEELKNQIIQIKQKNQQQRQNYIQQFQSLQRQYMNEKRERQGYRFQKIMKPQTIDTQPLLKFRLKKLIKSNKNKIKMIEQYKKHMKTIQQAFNEIKEKSGINDLDQITNTFIKSEEQNYSLYNYMDSLSRNIDSLEKANAELQQKISIQELDDGERKKYIEATPETETKKKQLQQYVQKKQQAAQELNKLIQAIKPNLKSTLIQLANSALNDDPSKNSQYQLGININERTIESYLSDLQKFINNLLFLKEEAKPKQVTNVKDHATNYSRPIPNFSSDDVYGKQRGNNNEIRQQNKFLQDNKFREYAIEYWQKRKNKNVGSSRD